MADRWRPWVVPVACGAAFLMLLVCVTTGVTEGLDASVRDACAAHRSSWLYRLAVDTTDVFSPLVDALVVAAGAGAVAARRRRLWPLVAAGVTGWAMVVLVVVLKHVVARPGPRPPLQQTPLSFPSGHTAAALVCYGTLALLGSAELPQRRSAFAVATAAVTVAVAAALVYTGFHWVTDVAGSVLLGGVLLPPLARWVRRRA